MIIDNEREYFIDITNRCERKYEYLLDKLALFQSENKKDKIKRGIIKNVNNYEWNL